MPGGVGRRWAACATMGLGLCGWGAWLGGLFWLLLWLELKPGAAGAGGAVAAAVAGAMAGAMAVAMVAHPACILCRAWLAAVAAAAAWYR